MPAATAPPKKPLLKGVPPQLDAATRADLAEALIAAPRLVGAAGNNGAEVERLLLAVHGLQAPVWLYDGVQNGRPASKVSSKATAAPYHFIMGLLLPFNRQQPLLWQVPENYYTTPDSAADLARSIGTGAIHMIPDRSSRIVRLHGATATMAELRVFSMYGAVRHIEEVLHLFPPRFVPDAGTRTGRAKILRAWRAHATAATAKPT